MVTKVRHLSKVLLRLTRPYHSSKSTRQVIVERRQTSWSKDLLYYGIPFFAAIAYLHWSSSDSPAHSQRINITNTSDSKEKGAGKYGIFIRLTSPRQVTKVVRHQLTEQEESLAKLAIGTVKDQAKLYKLTEELVKSVNSRAKDHNFFGIGLPNRVSIVARKVGGMPFHHFEAEGILLTADGIYWTTRKIPARAKNDFDKITSYPWMAFNSFTYALRSHWSSPNTKSQVTSRPPAKGRQTVGEAGVQDANPDSSSAAEQGESTEMTTQTSVDAKTSQTTDSQMDAPQKAISTGNHVDVLSSFLSQQKEAVRQSKELIPIGSAYAFLNAFTKAFTLQRAKHEFENHDVPGGNIIFECIVVVNGPKGRHVVLAVDADYDVQTETWGPVFVEPLQGLRTKAVRESRSRGMVFSEKGDK